MMSHAYERGLPEALAARAGDAWPTSTPRSRACSSSRRRLGLFDDPYRRCSGPDPETPARRAERRAVARRAASRSVVLLQNRDGVAAAARGAGADRAARAARRRRARRCSDPGRGPVAGTRRSSVLAGLRRGAARTPPIEHVEGVPIEGGDGGGHRRGGRGGGAGGPGDPLPRRGRVMSGEAASRARIDLPGRQAELAEAVLATGKPVVVLLFSGRPVAMPEVFEGAAAVLACWFPGSEAGHAVADVLTGASRPVGAAGGHLAARCRAGPDRLFGALGRAAREPCGQVHQQVPRHAEQPAVRLRPRPVLHHVRHRRSRSPPSPAASSSRSRSRTKAGVPEPRRCSCSSAIRWRASPGRCSS